jgi:hypothetical protein
MRPLVVNQFARWADIDVVFPVEGEVPTGEGSVRTLGLVPHGDVRRDLLLLHEPAEEAADPVGCIGCQPLRLQAQVAFGAVDHGLGRLDLVIGSGGRCLHVNDHSILDVDEIVEPIAELHAFVGFGGPRRGGIRW